MKNLGNIIVSKILIMKTKILNLLDSLEVKYKNFEHTPTFSCDEAKGVDIPWKRVKSLFLRNKKATKYYMVVLEDNVRFDSNKFRTLVWENKITFASEQRMMNKIWIKPGHVSPFATINNEEKDVEVIFNSTLKNCKIWFHPWKNDNTTILNISWMEKYLEHLGIKFSYLDL